MKTVFPNAMVAHVWAQQRQQNGRNAANSFWFAAEKIYSYRTLVATWQNGIALVDCRDFSQTTKSKHISTIHKAMRQCIAVPVVDLRNAAAQGIGAHAENTEYLTAQYNDELTRLSRCRGTPLSTPLEYCANVLQVYCNTFGLDAGVVPAWGADYLRIYTAWKQRNTARNTPEAIAKRVKAQAKKRERQLTQLEAIRADWLAGNNVAMPTFGKGRLSCAQGGALLRLEGDIVRTSWGATFPAEHAARAFQRIAACRYTGHEWRRNGQVILVGDFQIDRIDTSGNLRAGCHGIYWPQTERIARQLGLLAPM